MFQEQVFKSRIKIYSANKPNYFKPSNELSLSFNLAVHLFYTSSTCHWHLSKPRLWESCHSLLLQHNLREISNYFTFSSHLYIFVWSACASLMVRFWGWTSTLYFLFLKNIRLWTKSRYMCLYKLRIATNSDIFVHNLLTLHWQEVSGGTSCFLFF